MLVTCRKQAKHKSLKHKSGINVSHLISMQCCLTLRSPAPCYLIFFASFIRFCGGHDYTWSNCLFNSLFDFIYFWTRELNFLYTVSCVIKLNFFDQTEFLTTQCLAWCKYAIRFCKNLFSVMYKVKKTSGLVHD